jgi:Predicted hydrolase (metallo-beta-lactamase superfamily)
MRVIALFGRGYIGKTRCLGHLINLIHRETKGCNYLFEGRDARITLDYLGKRITICTWGDNDYEEGLNLDKIRQDNPDIAIVATRTKGETVEMVKRFCKKVGCEPKWVEKYVASFDDKSGQEYLNNLQAEQILDYVKGVIKGQLYYVDSITAIGGEEGHYHVHLIGAEMPDEEYPRTRSLELSRNELYYQETEQLIQEDDFVLYRPDSGHQFLLANDEPIAIALRNENLELRRELTEFIIQGDGVSFIAPREPDFVKSFHVNVGHGNCSMILSLYGSDYELWMVDCSTFDSKKRRDYSQNLYHCLDDIAGMLRIDLAALRITRFMLTHTHFDHYNGLQYLLKKSFVDANTQVYANLYYDCASPVWTRVLKGLKKLQCSFVEPIWNSRMRGAIHIYHPECRIYKSASSVTGSVANRIVSHVNDSSVVYGVELGGHAMVLPGDLEQEGFENMRSVRKCSSDLHQSDYYIVSHHGSINGHPTMACSPMATVLDCVTNNIRRTFLMGRDGMYPGIYSPVVMKYWQSQSCGLELTENAKHYIELDWATGNVRYN